MPQTIEYLEDGYIYAVYAGNFDMPGAIDMIAQVAAYVKKYHCYRVLGDFRNAVMDMTTVRIYDLPKLLMEQAEKSGVSITKLKRAMVTPPQQGENFRFFETVSTNQMQTIRIFQDLDEAWAWLMDD